MFIDTHCHVDECDNIQDLVDDIADNVIIISGVNDETNKQVIELCSKYKNIYGTIGIHPSEVNNICDNSLKFIENNMNNPKIVGIGEIGLDYHFECDKDKQKLYFVKQIELAKKYNKTIVIHSRDSALDTYDILKNTNSLRKVMHCYSYGIEMAHKYMDIGVKFGIGGVVTFKNSKKLVEVVKNLPLSELLLETDSPYLSPEPYRGKKNNPTNVIYVAKKIAEIKNIPEEIVFKITTYNAINQFDLKVDL